MNDIALDPMTGDLLIVDLGASLVTDIDQIAQNLAIRLKFFLGEWYLNILVGLPFYQYFFIKDPNQIQVETFLMDEIANTSGVDQITSFSTSYDARNRLFDVSFACMTISGNLELNLEIQ